MKPEFYEAGTFQVPAEVAQKGRNNTSKHTGSPCPCKKCDNSGLNLIENAVRSARRKRQGG